MHLTIHITFPNPAGNQLVILSSKIHNNNQFLFHNDSSYPSSKFSSDCGCCYFRLTTSVLSLIWLFFNLSFYSFFIYSSYWSLTHLFIFLISLLFLLTFRLSFWFLTYLFFLLIFVLSFQFLTCLLFLLIFGLSFQFFNLIYSSC